MERQYTKKFRSWLKKRPRDMRPLIEQCPPGKYRIKKGAPYAISCEGTLVHSHSYGKNQITVAVATGVKFKDADGNITDQLKPEKKWVQCVNVIVTPENKLPEAIERENMLAVQQIESRIMDDKFSNAQKKITDELIAKIPQDYTATEEKVMNDIDTIRKERALTPEEEKAYKEASEAFTKKEQEKAEEVKAGVTKGLKEQQVNLVEEAQAIIKSAETQKEIKALQEKFHKDNVVVAVEPHWLELVEIAPDILLQP